MYKIQELMQANTLISVETNKPVVQGMRSIGKWGCVNKEQFDKEWNIPCTELNEHQISYAKTLFEKNKEETLVFMQEKYGKMLRIHCIKSFVYWFLANLESKKLVAKHELPEIPENLWSEKDTELENICLDILMLEKK